MNISKIYVFSCLALAVLLGCNRKWHSDAANLLPDNHKHLMIADLHIRLNSIDDTTKFVAFLESESEFGLSSIYKNELFESFITVNGVQYKVWDVPSTIYEKEQRFLEYMSLLAFPISHMNNDDLEMDFLDIRTNDTVLYIDTTSSTLKIYNVLYADAMGYDAREDSLILAKIEPIYVGNYLELESLPFEDDDDSDEVSSIEDVLLREDQLILSYATRNRSDYEIFIFTCSYEKHSDYKKDEDVYRQVLSLKYFGAMKRGRITYLKSVQDAFGASPVFSDGHALQF